MKFLRPDSSKCEGKFVCERTCSKTFFKVEDSACSSIQVRQELKGFSLNVCNQCGECVSVCPVKALYRNKFGTVMVNKEACVSCFMCVGFCPTLSMRRGPNHKSPFKCVACGACVKTCPKGALALEEVDHSRLPA
ncbi:4Fe-4S binding protein [bacterium]|nr:4Fe-4S binding protein [bacterium]